MSNKRNKESVYHEFENGDILQSVIHTNPRIVMASGTYSGGQILGWRSNTGVSSSISLYEGVRARSDVGPNSISGLQFFPIDLQPTNSIDKVYFISGSYPATGSVRMVKVRTAPAPGQFSTYVTSEDWYQEHWAPINLLFDYYGTFNPQYFTGSYDYYMLYLKEQSRYLAPAVWFSGSKLATLSNAFTLEMQVKPTLVTSSFQDFVLQSQRQRFKFYITGSTGHLVFTDYTSSFSSSVALTPGIWSHVALVAGSGSASFYVDLSPAGAFSYTGSLTQVANSLVVGAEHVVSGTAIVADNGYCGYLFESRIWDYNRSFTDLSASANKTLFDSSSGSVHLVHYARFNDGPIATMHGQVAGSGTFDYANPTVGGQFQNVNAGLPLSPIWSSNDNQNFMTRKVRTTGSVGVFKVLHVPSMFYGRQIATGSVLLVDHAYDNQGIVRVIKDDGRGSLYISGSVTRPISGESYDSMRWNKVGNVFYTEGLIVLTDPSLLDFGSLDGDWGQTTDLLQVAFSGDQRIHTDTFMCRLGSAQANASNNSTWSRKDVSTVPGDVSSGKTIRKFDGTTWITAIGIYNEERKLVAVAKLAQPIRKREKDKLNIKLKFDF